MHSEGFHLIPLSVIKLQLLKQGSAAICKTSTMVDHLSWCNIEAYA